MLSSARVKESRRRLVLTIVGLALLGSALYYWMFNYEETVLYSLLVAVCAFLLTLASVWSRFLTYYILWIPVVVYYCLITSIFLLVNPVFLVAINLAVSLEYMHFRCLEKWSDKSVKQGFVRKLLLSTLVTYVVIILLLLFTRYNAFFSIMTTCLIVMFHSATTMARVGQSKK